MSEIRLSESQKELLAEGGTIYHRWDWYDIEWDESHTAIIDGIKCFLVGGFLSRAVMRYDKHLEHKEERLIMRFVDKHGYIPPELMRD